MREQDALDRGLAAHGGLDTWQSYGMLEYDLVQGDEGDHQMIDLHTRKVLVANDTYKIGFDGENVWITPGMDAFGGSPRFYSSLYFYFFGIPFVLADPGTNREDLGQRTVAGKTYDVIQVTFGNGVGDSPDDAYLPHFDPETHQLAMLLYTATYRDQEPSDSYNALVYDEWQEVGGLLVPKKMTFHRWDNDQQQLGEPRGERVFNNVRFEQAAPDPSRFAMPEGAAMDTPPQGSDG